MADDYEDFDDSDEVADFVGKAAQIAGTPSDPRGDLVGGIVYRVVDDEYFEDFVASKVRAVQRQVRDGGPIPIEHLAALQQWHEHDGATIGARMLKRARLLEHVDEALLDAARELGHSAVHRQEVAALLSWCLVEPHMDAALAAVGLAWFDPLCGWLRGRIGFPAVSEFDDFLPGVVDFLLEAKYLDQPTATHWARLERLIHEVNDRDWQLANETVEQAAEESPPTVVRLHFSVVDAQRLDGDGEGSALLRATVRGPAAERKLTLRQIKGIEQLIERRHLDFVGRSNRRAGERLVAALNDLGGCEAVTSSVREARRGGGGRPKRILRVELGVPMTLHPYGSEEEARARGAQEVREMRFGPPE